MRLKSAVALAAIKAAYTELGLTAAPTTDATTGIATTNRIQFGVSTLNRILMQLEQGEFILQNTSHTNPYGFVLFGVWR